MKAIIRSEVVKQHAETRTETNRYRRYSDEFRNIFENVLFTHSLVNDNERCSSGTKKREEVKTGEEEEEKR